MPGKRRTLPQAGFTLIEILIATFIFALLTISMIGSIVFSSRATRLNTNAIAAKNVAQGFFERMAIDTFANVNPPPGGIYDPPQGGYADIGFAAEPPVYLDEALGIRCQVDFDFKGYGRVESATLTDVQCTQVSWEYNEWAGDTLYLVSGPGAGQYSLIASSTSNELHLAEPLLFPADSSTRYMINNGKTVEITTTWMFQDRSYSQTIESLVVNYRNDPNLGF